MTFTALDPELMKKRLAPPKDGPVRLLIDADTANEIDDQYALAWALLSPEHMSVEAVASSPRIAGGSACVGEWRRTSNAPGWRLSGLA